MPCALPVLGGLFDGAAKGMTRGGRGRLELSIRVCAVRLLPWCIADGHLVRSCMGANCICFCCGGRVNGRSLVAGGRGRRSPVAAGVGTILGADHLEEFGEWFRLLRSVFVVILLLAGNALLDSNPGSCSLATLRADVAMEAESRAGKRREAVNVPIDVFRTLRQDILIAWRLGPAEKVRLNETRLHVGLV